MLGDPELIRHATDAHAGSIDTWWTVGALVIITLIAAISTVIWSHAVRRVVYHIRPNVRETAPPTIESRFFYLLLAPTMLGSWAGTLAWLDPVEFQSHAQGIGAASGTWAPVSAGITAILATAVCISITHFLRLTDHFPFSVSLLVLPTDALVATTAFALGTIAGVPLLIAGTLVYLISLSPLASIKELITRFFDHIGSTDGHAPEGKAGITNTLTRYLSY